MHLVYISVLETPLIILIIMVYRSSVSVANINVYTYKSIKQSNEILQQITLSLPPSILIWYLSYSNLSFLELYESPLYWHIFLPSCSATSKDKVI